MFPVPVLLRPRRAGSWNRNLQRLLIFLALAVPSAASAADRAAADRILDQATAQIDAGDYETAARSAQQAAALYAALGDSHDRAIALNEAGLARMYAGSYPEARASFEEALRIALPTPDAERIVEERMNLGSVDFFTGRYGDAAAEYAAVESVLAAHRAEPWTRRRRGILLSNQATLAQRLGRYREALAAYRLALADTAEVRPGEHAQMLANVGVLYRRMGDPYKALDAYEQAGAIFAREEDVDGELGVLKNRGIVLALDLGRPAEARDAFAEAFRRATAAGDAREALQAQLYGAEATLRLGDAAGAAREFLGANDAARKMASVEDRWKALYGLARCETIAGDDAAAMKHLAEAVSVIEEIRDAIRVPSQTAGFFNDKREVFDALIALRLRHGAAPAELFALIERGHSRGWRERLGLSRTIDLPAIQRALPAGTLLLDYWTSSSSGAVVVAITAHGARVHTITVERERIRALVEGLSRGPGFDWRTAGVALGAELLPPALFEAGETSPHVVIVSDRALASVPFELLSIAGVPLLEHHDVTYVPTAALLLRSPPPARGLALPWSIQLRGFADPVFGSAALDDGRHLPPRLPASARELQGIAAELGGRSLLHVGADDRKEHLRERSDAPLLHLATHAFVDPGAIEQSRIVFSATRAGGAATYLFLNEAYQLPLANVELAVLSACDTERGELTPGEGVESFSRAFLAAGARSTVTTFWRVPDATTAPFMRLFYHHLQRGATRAEALRRAKLRFLASDGAAHDPHYWAAFVLTGDGLRPVATALRWSTLIAGVAGVVVVLLGVMVAARARRSRR